MEAVKIGWPGDAATSENKWSFSAGFLYSLTVITTIGENFIFLLNLNNYVICLI